MNNNLINLIFEPLEYVESKTIDHTVNENGVSRKTLRSMIHPEYANRFIGEIILDDTKDRE